MQIPYTVAARTDTGMNNARLGLWLFLASETMLFGGLISAYAFLRTGSATSEFGPHLSEVPLAGINTLVLLVSSAVMTFAVWSLRNRDYRRYRFLLGIVIFLGLLFVGIKGVDYSHKFSHGLYPATSTYLAVFFTLTGVHALHVIGGVVVNAYLWLTARKLWETEPDRLVSRISVAGTYWNFVDAVWIVLFLLLYIV